jgi:phospholipid/cholesterol/gamma-HCH transport system substrate-binding protein
MRRLIAIAALGVALPLVAVLGLGAADKGKGYEVRAIFDNVAAAVPGEDVKVAGAKVGVIQSMDVTPDKKAAVTLRIDDGRFTPFRSDATCTVRPQSLIGEKFVECKPGTQAGTPLRKIDRGDGEGQHLLPVAQTSSPVDLDLVNDVMRLPYRQRLSILLNEFGTALAGRGKDLNAVIHRANPALRETDRTLAILARQNRVLAQLAQDSDTVLAPLAREKRRVSDFIVQANATAQATAERRGDIRGSIRRLPAFLRQLRPLMADLGQLADQGTPVVRDLGDAAPDLSRLIRQLGPFSRAARPAIRTLGRATVTGRPALIRSRPLVQDLGRFARDARPVSVNLDDLTKSLDRTGGVERIMDYLFFQMTAINGFDSVGHYLRAALIANLCTNYSIREVSGCPANFTVSSSSSAAAGRRSLGAQLAPVSSRGSAGGSVSAAAGLLRQVIGQEDPAAVRLRRQNLARVRRRAGGPSPALQGQGSGQPLLDYLLGSGR